MKKFICCLMLTIVCYMATGCSSCQSENNKQEEMAKDSAVSQLETAKAILGDFYVVEANYGQLVPEHAISLDREWLFLNVGGKYQWFETEVCFERTFSDSLSTFKIEKIRNIFHNVTEVDGGYNVEVFNNITTKDGTIYQRCEGFVLQDYPINDCQINLTFAEAYEKMMNANITKPDGRYCVLRKPVSPNDYQHALYIFGNKKSGLVAVDAVTGDVFLFLGGPLGEWP